MINFYASRPVASFVIRRAGPSYAYEKTLRALLHRIETGKYVPKYNKEMAGVFFRFEILAKHDCLKYQFKEPESFDDWQSIIGRIFTGANLSRKIITGRNSETGQRFPDNIRQAHVEVLENAFNKIGVLGDWFYYNQSILRGLVSNF